MQIIKYMGGAENTSLQRMQENMSNQQQCMVLEHRTSPQSFIGMDQNFIYLVTYYH